MVNSGVLIVSLVKSSHADAAVPIGDLQLFVNCLRDCISIPRQSATQIMETHGKQLKSKLAANPSNPLLSKYFDPSTPAELRNGQAKPGRKQVAQAQACTALEALISCTTKYDSHELSAVIDYVA